MDNIVGTIKSKKTGIVYFVKWDINDQYSWISENRHTWTLVCTDVRNAIDAVSCAQRYIDGQPDLF